MKKFFGGKSMKMKERKMELEERLLKARGQEKVKIHEELCGREYNNKR